MTREIETIGLGFDTPTLFLMLGKHLGWDAYIHLSGVPLLLHSADFLGIP